MIATVIAVEDGVVIAIRHRHYTAEQVVKGDEAIRKGKDCACVGFRLQESFCLQGNVSRARKSEDKNDIQLSKRCHGDQFDPRAAAAPSVIASRP